MTDWKQEYCQFLPEELELVGRDLYIQRRNIEAVTVEDEFAPSTGYICESRFISTSERNMLAEIEAIDTAKAIDEYNMQLIEDGVL